MTNLNSIASTSELVQQVRTIRPVSGKYITMDTPTLVRQVVDSLGVDANIRVLGGKFRTNTRHVVAVEIRKPLMLVGTECYPMVYITNSYAGESSLKVTVGFHRLVCSNGMVAGSVDFKETINHVGKRNMDKFTQLSETIKRAVEFSCTKLEEIAARANSHQVTEEELKILLGSISASAGLSKRIKEAMQYARPEDMTGPLDPQGRPTLTLWGLWNIINEQMRKGGRSEVRQLVRNDGLANAVMQLAA